MNFEWGTINDELWRLAAYSKFSQSATGSLLAHYILLIYRKPSRSQSGIAAGPFCERAYSACYWFYEFCFRASGTLTKFAISCHPPEFIIDCTPGDKIGEVLFENNNVTISKKKNKKDMLSIWQWAIAYDICMSTYMTNHLNSVQKQNQHTCLHKLETCAFHLH
jgi:hypothetical protein